MPFCAISCRRIYKDAQFLAREGIWATISGLVPGNSCALGLRQGAIDFQTRQINDGSDLQKKICPDNAIDGKTVVHGSDFDFKVAHLQLTHRQTIDALDEDELRATDTRMRCT